MKIVQLVAGFLDGDAISNYALELEKIIQSWGHSTQIYGLGRHIHSLTKDRCLDIRLYQPDSSDVLIFHFSVGSEMTSFFQTTPGKKVLIYHNITPAKYFQAISEEKAMVLREGRKQLVELANVPDLSLAVSPYNVQELQEAGFNDPKVFPLIFNVDSFNIRPSKKILKHFEKKGTNILFVGRVAPNKRCENVIKVFFYYKKTIDPLARLFIVGSFAGMDRYLATLRALTIELDLSDVFFTGHVTQEELVAYYQLSDLFLCMSEHEGFCIPLLEAMHFKRLVFAYDKAGVPGTLKGAGILIKEKKYIEIAELMNMILNDESLKSSIIQKQNERSRSFRPEALADKFKKLIQPLFENHQSSCG